MSDSLSAPRTTSTDGFLVNGHPELGDVVYDGSGNPLGRVEFFYDRLDSTKYRVKVEGHAEDPVVVKVTPVVDGEIVIGARLVAMPGLAAKLATNTLGASIAISNG